MTVELGKLQGNVDAETFTVGELIYVSSGEYSDYGVHCVARVLKPFNLSDFHTKHSYRDAPAYGIDHARLTSEGYIEELPARELWLP